MASRTSYHSYYDQSFEDKYLTVPAADTMSSEDENEFNKHRRESSQFFNRVVGFVVTVCAISACGVLLALHYTKGHDTYTSDDEVYIGCYESPACTNVYAKYDTTTGFTNLTGWDQSDSALPTNSCCDICATQVEPLQGSAKAVDNNYLLLDQIWMPQFCNALKEGHDPTLSHLQGSLCLGSVTNSTPKLTIHGLWPNIAHGNNTCCYSPSAQPYSPLDPALVEQWPIWPELQSTWFDPTVSCTYANTECSICYLLNHEWQKHGTCFASFFSPASQANLELAYFSTGLMMADSLYENASAVINRMNGTVQAITAISSLYPYNVHVMCDPQVTYSQQENVGVFLEVQTCWNVTNPSSTVFPSLQNVTMIDCLPAFESSFSSSCPNAVYVPNFNDE
ncbi:hypothetical protein EON65_46230 [archaeon]|nr:MAG: hypothetical protein EON65_46230 [archaeon]